MKPSREQIAGAIRLARIKSNWKPGSAERHLLKRKLRGHLSPTATIHDYERIIQAVLHGSTADVYLFSYDDRHFVAVVESIDERCWLVMFDLDGVMESAYIVERPENYLRKETVELVGSLALVLQE